MAAASGRRSVVLVCLGVVVMQLLGSATPAFSLITNNNSPSVRKLLGNSWNFSSVVLTIILGEIPG